MLMLYTASFKFVFKAHLKTANMADQSAEQYTW